MKTFIEKRFEDIVEHLDAASRIAERISTEGLSRDDLQALQNIANQAGQAAKKCERIVGSFYDVWANRNENHPWVK